MFYINRFIAAHPIKCAPYDKIEFFDFDQNRTALYRVIGGSSLPCGAYEALGKAFATHGGKCFYCGEKFAPQRLSNAPGGAHRDHVVPSCRGGSKLLHNLVIACKKCGDTKAGDGIHEFRPRSAQQYLDALNRHVADCLRAVEEPKS